MAIGSTFSINDTGLTYVAKRLNILNKDGDTKWLGYLSLCSASSRHYKVC